jgi:hypothetical protein
LTFHVPCSPHLSPLPLTPPPHPPPPPPKVNYVGKAANLYQDAGYKLSGSAYVIEKYLGTSWLWDKVRWQWLGGGGVFGACRGRRVRATAPAACSVAGQRVSVRGR